MRRNFAYNKKIRIYKREFSNDDLGDPIRSGTTTISEPYAKVKPMSGDKMAVYSQIKRKDMIEIKTHAPQTYTMSNDYLISHNSNEYQVIGWQLDERELELTIDAARL